MKETCETCVCLIISKKGGENNRVQRLPINRGNLWIVNNFRNDKDLMGLIISSKERTIYKDGSWIKR